MQSTSKHRHIILAVKKHTKFFFNNKNNVAIYCVVLLLVAGSASAYLYRKNLAELVWNTFHTEYATILDSHNALLYREIGNYYFAGEHYNIQKAKEYFEKAMAVDDRLPSVHYQLARIHFLTGFFDEAIREINKEIEFFPEYKRSYYIRGLTYGYMDDFDRAAADFKEFLEWKPDSWAGHNDLVWVYFRKGDYINAEKYARQGLERVPCNPWLSNSLGTALLNLGRYEEAKRYLLEAKGAFASVSPKNWGTAYPGNSPQVYNEGLVATRKSVDENVALVQSKLGLPGEVPDGIRCTL